MKFPFICFKCKAKINANNDLIKAKRKATCIAKYGVENPFQSEEKKAKIRQTCKERYGVENCAQNSEVYAKVKKTNIKRYGVPCTLNTKENLIKRKETWIEHYGVNNPNKSKDIIEKRIETNIKKYGVTNHMKTEESKLKSMQTKLEKYGDAFYSELVIYYYDNIYFRSKPELCFYIYNKDQGKDIVYEPHPYFKYQCEDKEYYYKPDFLLENKLYEKDAKKKDDAIEKYENLLLNSINKLYLGENLSEYDISDNTISMVREFVDKVAEDNGVTTEKVLSSVDYLGDLKGA